MRRSFLVSLALVSAGLCGYALAQRTPAERDSTAGRPFRIVAVPAAAGSASKFVDRDLHVWEMKPVAQALEQLAREGYEPIDIAGLGPDLAILARQVADGQ